ncbi:MAG TPA: hypothetical protein VFN03_00805, partial [Trueperaceae bacterium]|nr:hypothetical protein [Trueperaceae bacterium]
MTDLVIASGLGSLPPGLRSEVLARADAAVLILGDAPRLHTCSGVTELLSHDQRSALADEALTIAEERTDDCRDAGLAGVQLRAAQLSSAAKLDTFVGASEFLRAVAALRAAVTLLGPVRVTWYSDDQRLASAVATATALPDFTLARAHGPQHSRSERLVELLKRQRLDWSARYLSTLPGAVRSRRALHDFTHRGRSAAAARSDGPEAGGPVLALFDVRNSGMIANLAAVTDAVRARGVHCVGLYMEPRVAAVLERDHPTLPILPLAVFSDGSVVRRALSVAGAVRRTMTGEVRRWSTAPAVPAVVAQVEGVASEVGTVRPSDTAALRSYLADGFTWPYVAQGLIDVGALETALTVLRPRALLTSSDAHKYSRLAVLTAARTGVRSMVVQHGAPVGERIYLPVTADVMATWGPWCWRWFADRGVETSRLVSAGYPRGATRSAPTSPRGAVSALLFAAQPVADDVTADLLQRVFAAMEERDELRLTVRPHPGESRRGLLAAIVARAPSHIQRRARLSVAGAPLAEDLSQADVVLS